MPASLTLDCVCGGQGGRLHVNELMCFNLIERFGQTDVGGDVIDLRERLQSIFVDLPTLIQFLLECFNYLSISIF